MSFTTGRYSEQKLNISLLSTQAQDRCGFTAFNDSDVPKIGTLRIQYF